ncbi:unknown [Agathobacter rectalis CAG:36]|uniref:Uncharacterized protein n=1 Tax=Agathobacter rectalis CAG:36 TaxID=1263079 RepID=R6UDP6_9FIRM|nr:unknown [Agathobacter rectalis CAG:36]
MFKRINSKENKENRWPCIICDEWSWDVLAKKKRRVCSS